LSTAVRAGSLGALELTSKALAAAESSSELGAVWFLDEPGAKHTGRAIEEMVRQGGDPGRLAGVPLLVKDAFDVAGTPGGAGGPAITPADDADAVAACRREGAVIIGKAAMHQLGWGMSGQCPGHPPCRNPRAPDRQPGGSSSGSAVAVAAGIVRLALGGDTGGSVRLPAAWCGVVGFKPAQAAVSRRGLAPLAPQVDAVGYLGATVDDCQLAHEALGAAPCRATAAVTDVRGMRVATDPSLLDGVADEVMAGFERALQALELAGVELVQKSLPPHQVPLGRMFAAALSVHWGELVDLHPQLFGDDVRSGVEAGRATDLERITADWAERERLRQAATLEADAFACPAAPILPPPLDDPDDVRTAGRFLRPFNVLDWPAIVVPCSREPLPVGFQLAAPGGREDGLFALAKAVEAMDD
jgi:aspartyl-tRNA(Asn)/glutamyl-tRNA(Gln) amidotransferase subunit A